MGSGWARVALVGILAAASVALGLATAHHTFAWVEGESADGRTIDLRGEPTVEATPGGLVLAVAGDNQRLQVTVRSPVSQADRVPVQVALVDETGEHAGAGVLDIDEAGAYLGGTLRAEVGGFTLHGGLRVRAVAPGRASHSRPRASGRRVRR